MKKDSISRKYVLWFSAVTLVILFTVLLATIIVLARSSTLLRDDLREGTIENFAAFQQTTMYNLADFMRRELFTPLFQLDIERIDRTLKDLRKGTPVISICIADESGKVLTDGTDENPSYGMQLPLDRKQLESTPVLIEQTGGGRRVTFQIGVKDYVAGYGEIIYSEEPMREAIASQEATVLRIWLDFRKNFLGIAVTWAAFIALLAVLLSVFFSRTLTRPLIALRDATKRIAAGDLEHRVEIRTQDELGELAASFNRMGERLQKRTSELARTNEALQAEIEERKLKEWALRQSEQRLEMAQQAGGVGVFDWDLIDNAIFWTEQLDELFGMPPGDFPKTYEVWAGHVHPDDLPGLERQLRRSLREHRTHIDMEYRFIRADGQTRWMAGSAQISYAAAGTPTRMIGTTVDITDRKEIQEKLTAAKNAAEAANFAKSEFLANMSHEMRTPLAGAMGMMNLVLKMEIGEQQRKMLEMAKRSTDSLLRLISDLLDYSRLEAGTMTFEKRIFSVPELIKSSVEVVSIQAQEKGLLLSWTVEESVPQQLAGDEGRLRQVLVNLLGNSVKFTREGEIEVTARPYQNPEANEAHFLLFSVRDTGIGIPPDQLEGVFGKFTQVDSSWTRKQGGAGLGLALSKQIVEKIGGRIWAESRVGEGSVFNFTYPLESHESAPAYRSTRA